MAAQTKESITVWLKKVAALEPEQVTDAHKAAIGRALAFLYARQTSDEQSSKQTSHSNGMGFNGVDSQFLSDVAQRATKYGLSPKQTRAVAKCIVKYSGQLLEMCQPKEN